MAYGDIINSPHIANSQYREKNGVETINTAVLLKDTATPMGGLAVNYLSDTLNLGQLPFIKASNRAGLYVGIQGSVCVLPSGQSQPISKGTTTATTTNQLVCSSKDFNAEGVQVRDVVVNTTDNTFAFVAGVNATSLALVDVDAANSNIMATSENFEIYRAVIFQNVQAGTFIPIQVDRVFRTGTTADEIIAIY